MGEEVIIMDNCLEFFDELYAQILSHPKSTVITHTYSVDRDVWMKTETNIIQYAFFTEDGKKIPTRLFDPLKIEETIYTEAFKEPKKDVIIATIPQLFTRLIEAWYRHIVKIHLIVEEEEFVANENFMQDIRRIASNALCFSMENYRSIRLYDMLKENGYKVFGP